MSISRALYICARTNFGLSRICHFDWFESYVTRVWSWFHFNTIRANSEPQAGDLSTWKTHLHAIDSCYRKYLCQTWCSSWKWKKIAMSSKYAIQRRLADQGDRYRLENERFAGSLCINANCRVFSWYLWLTMLSNTQTPKHPSLSYPRCIWRQIFRTKYGEAEVCSFKSISPLQEIKVLADIRLDRLAWSCQLKSYHII